MVHLDVDALNAMSAGIVQGDMMVFVLAADQQQKVHCSRHSESLALVQGHRVEGESKSAMPSRRIAWGTVVRRKPVDHSWVRNCSRI
jgi:hypothetical protein